MADLGRPLHWLAGFGLGALARVLPRERRAGLGNRLDTWAWEREWRQNRAGQNPNLELSPKQRAEAGAWLRGFNVAAGLPHPPPDRLS